jgi:hypothetical protein
MRKLLLRCSYNFFQRKCIAAVIVAYLSTFPLDVLKLLNLLLLVKKNEQY